MVEILNIVAGFVLALILGGVVLLIVMIRRIMSEITGLKDHNTNQDKRLNRFEKRLWWLVDEFAKEIGKTPPPNTGVDVFADLILALQTNFSLEEMAELAFDSQIQWEDLSGDTRARKANSLIKAAFAEKKEKLLLKNAKTMRPQVEFFQRINSNLFQGI